MTVISYTTLKDSSYLQIAKGKSTNL